MALLCGVYVSSGRRSANPLVLFPPGVQFANTRSILEICSSLIWCSQWEMGMTLVK